MGFCINCGSPTDRPDNICPSCAGQSVQQTPFAQQQGADNSSTDYVTLSKNGTKRDYWTALFDNPMIAFNQIFKGAAPENNFDISEYEKKFNWGAALGGFVWLAFNSNFWFGILGALAVCFASFIVGIVFGILSFIPFLGPILTLLISLALFVAIVLYFGLNGNKMTYKTRPYRDLENFKKNQKIWAWAMVGWYALSFLISIGSIVAYIGMILTMVGSSIH